MKKHIIMKLLDFYLRKIKEWEAEREIARNNGDYQRFAFCEREIENYELLIGQMGCKDENQ